MKKDEKMTQALEEKAREQSKALSLWLQQEFNLSSQYHVKVKATLSIKQVPVPKLRQIPQGWVFDQQPTSQDWQTVIQKVQTLSTTGKPYQRSKRIWRNMVEELQGLQREANRAHVSNATRLNAYLEYHTLPYRLVRVNKPGDDVLYSLLVATSATATP